MTGDELSGAGTVVAARPQDDTERPLPPAAESRPAEVTVRDGAVVAALAALLTVPVFRLWHMKWSVPLVYKGDATSVNSLFKGVLEHGWYLRNTNIGAPFSQDYRAYPFGDNLLMFLVRALSPFTHDSSLVLNGIFLLTFPAAALAAWWLFRHLRLSNSVATVMAVLYAFLPFHFWRSESHLFLSDYWVVPIAIYLLLRIMAGDSFFSAGRPSDAISEVVSDPGRPLWDRKRLGRGAVLVLACVVVATASAYYGAFTLILALLAALVVAIRKRRFSAVMPGIVVASLLGLALILNTAPSLLYQSAHGGSANSAARVPGDSENYSLKIADLVLPRDNHRVHALASLNARYHNTFPVPSEAGAQALGLVGTVGFVFLMALAVGGWAWGRPGSVVDTITMRLATLNLLAVLVATLGGIATLVALANVSQVRAWNRMSIFIGCFSLAAVGLLFEHLGARLAGRSFGRPVFAALLVGLAVIGLADQTSNADIPAYGAVRAEWNSDATFVAGIERTLTPNAMVYQFPYIRFPESPPVVNMQDYDELKGWLHSTTLRWSYGAFKDTPAGDWQTQVSAFPMKVVLPALALVGFQGATVDRAGYTDQGTSFEGSLSSTLGPSILSSPNGGLDLYDFRPLAAQLAQQLPAAQRQAVAQAVTELPALHAGPGFSGPGGEGPGASLDAPPNAALSVVSGVAQRLVFRARLSGSSGSLALRFPDGSTDTVVLTPAGRDYVREFDVGVGSSAVGLVTTDSAGAGVHLADYSVSGVAFDQFAQNRM